MEVEREACWSGIQLLVAKGYAVLGLQTPHVRVSDVHHGIELYSSLCFGVIRLSESYINIASLLWCSWCCGQNITWFGRCSIVAREGIDGRSLYTIISLRSYYQTQTPHFTHLKLLCPFLYRPVVLTHVLSVEVGERSRGVAGPDLAQNTGINVADQDLPDGV